MHKLVILRENYRKQSHVSNVSIRNIGSLHRKQVVEINEQRISKKLWWICTISIRLKEQHQFSEEYRDIDKLNNETHYQIFHILGKLSKQNVTKLIRDMTIQVRLLFALQ